MTHPRHIFLFSSLSATKNCDFVGDPTIHLSCSPVPAVDQNNESTERRQSLAHDDCLFHIVEHIQETSR